MVEEFYEGVVQHLKPWTPPAPSVQESHEAAARDEDGVSGLLAGGPDYRESPPKDADESPSAGVETGQNHALVGERTLSTHNQHAQQDVSLPEIASEPSQTIVTVNNPAASSELQVEITQAPRSIPESPVRNP